MTHHPMDEHEIKPPHRHMVHVTVPRKKKNMASVSAAPAVCSASCACTCATASRPCYAEVDRVRTGDNGAWRVRSGKTRRSSASSSVAELARRMQRVHACTGISVCADLLQLELLTLHHPLLVCHLTEEQCTSEHYQMMQAIMPSRTFASASIFANTCQRKTNQSARNKLNARLLLVCVPQFRSLWLAAPAFRAEQG